MSARPLISQESIEQIRRIEEQETHKYYYPMWRDQVPSEVLFEMLHQATLIIARHQQRTNSAWMVQVRMRKEEHTDIIEAVDNTGQVMFDATSVGVDRWAIRIARDYFPEGERHG